MFSKLFRVPLGTNQDVARNCASIRRMRALVRFSPILPGGSASSLVTVFIPMKQGSKQGQGPNELLDGVDEGARARASSHDHPVVGMGVGSNHTSPGAQPGERLVVDL